MQFLGFADFACYNKNPFSDYITDKLFLQIFRNEVLPFEQPPVTSIPRICPMTVISFY